VNLPGVHIASRDRYKIYLVTWQSLVWLFL